MEECEEGTRNVVGWAKDEKQRGGSGGMGDRVVAVAECGATFTVCATVDNVLMFWGSR